MKILKQGKETKIKCPACKAQLSITETDIQHQPYPMGDENSGFIICPSCGKRINLERGIWTNNWKVVE